MTAPTVDAPVRQRIAAYGQTLAELGRQRDALSAELAEVRAAQQANLLTDGEVTDPALFRARARQLTEQLADVDGEIATVSSVRDALVAEVRAQEQAERAQAEYEAAAEAHVQAVNARVQGQRVAQCAPDSFVAAQRAALAELIADVTAIDGLHAAEVRSWTRLKAAAEAVGAPVPPAVPDALEAVAVSLDLRRRPVLLAAHRGDKAGALQSSESLVRS